MIMVTMMVGTVMVGDGDGSDGFNGGNDVVMVMMMKLMM